MTTRVFTWDELEDLELPYASRHHEIIGWDFPRRAVVFEHEGRHWRVEFNDTEATDGPLWDGEVEATEVRKVEKLVQEWEPT